MTRVELLTAIPPSGSISERNYDASARDNVWVQFSTDGEEPWVGVFGAGTTSPFSAAVPFADDDGGTVLVIAGGQGYIVDARTGELRRKTPWDYSYSAVAPPTRDFVLVADTTTIFAAARSSDTYATRSDPAWYDSDRLLRARRVALDGIVFDEPGPDVLTGKVWDPDGWYAFRLHYDGMLFERGAHLDSQQEAFGAVPGRGGFPGSQAYYTWVGRFRL